MSFSQSYLYSSHVILLISFTVHFFTTFTLITLCSPYLVEKRGYSRLTNSTLSYTTSTTCHFNTVKVRHDTVSQHFLQSRHPTQLETRSNATWCLTISTTTQPRHFPLQQSPKVGQTRHGVSPFPPITTQPRHFPLQQSPNTVVSQSLTTHVTLSCWESRSNATWCLTISTNHHPRQPRPPVT